MILLLKLIIAHLIGDFFLQTKSSVKEKNRLKLRSPMLYLHVLIHVVLLGIVIWDLEAWPIILIIGGSHLIIDALKIILQTNKNRRWLFFLDQLFHLTVIVLAWYFYSNPQLDFDQVDQRYFIALSACLIFLTRPTSFIMQMIFAKWDISKLTEGNESLKDAGQYIGILERILVFIFIIVGRWEAVGFLITAKSVFRFGDLKEAKQRQLTEYVLIGTLISFGIAIVIGLVFLYLIN
ncbi:MAG: DUF3307 domain-containing protein [Flavobacteriaceae bacterium]|nr:DUF3307 domain-containing protein [Bacteroidia bacterium]MBT8286426.1 DUF3307 domain-containing protein [Bacteroidia bacterium]NNF75927.1 DUF3307 domain-containing protein [Flavobacteriaceae bacterium]NNK73395.1 DUF3307 domain-containing protein [Flavobacteriaceae bacterium]